MTNEEFEEFSQNAFEHLQKAPPAKLILFNDDFNTFEWAIQSFIDIYNYSVKRSKQLCLIIHYKGQATIKTADITILKSLQFNNQKKQLFYL